MRLPELHILAAVIARVQAAIGAGPLGVDHAAGRWRGSRRRRWSGRRDEVQLRRLVVLVLHRHEQILRAPRLGHSHRVGIGRRRAQVRQTTEAADRRRQKDGDRAEQDALGRPRHRHRCFASLRVASASRQRQQQRGAAALRSITDAGKRFRTLARVLPPLFRAAELHFLKVRIRGTMAKFGVQQ